VPGYGGPVGLDVRPTRSGRGAWVVADQSLLKAPNLVTGANREGFHLTGVNYPRDFHVTEILDFARAPGDASCARCGAFLEPRAGCVVARRLVHPESHSFAAPDGRRTKGGAATLEVSLGAAAACVVDAARRENGFCFPSGCAPFHVHLIQLPGGADLEPALSGLAREGVSVLVDDRDLSAGVKLSDADWIGAPFVVVSGRRSAQAGGVELRSAESRRIVAIPDVLEAVLRQQGELM